MSNFQKALASAFITKPSSYSFVHQFVAKQGSSCACGHFIKNVFVVENNTGHAVHLGSECINTYSELNHVAAQIKIEAEKERLRIEQEQDAKFQSLLAIASELATQVHELINNRVFISRELYASRHLPATKNLKRLSSKIKKIEAYIVDVQKMLPEYTSELENKVAAKKQREEKIAEIKAKSNYVGTIKERITINVEVIFQDTFEKMGYHGPETCFITKFKSGDNVLVTFTNIGAQEVGTKLSIKGTVVKHTHYRDEAQTTLNRVTVV